MRTLFPSFILLILVLASASASAQGPGILYDNGLVCPGGCYAAWQINGGHVVSDSFFVNTNVKVTGFDLYVWEFPDDKVLRIQWSITSAPFGGTIYGSGATLLNDSFYYQNEFGYNIDKLTVTGLNIPLPPGSYWITLQNAVDRQHVSVLWDANGGAFCHSLGCPSSAFESQAGRIYSETFDIRGVHLPGAEDSE
jgi:hypothetical protein